MVSPIIFEHNSQGLDPYLKTMIGFIFLNKLSYDTSWASGGYLN
jgi:hypothetical protein